MDDLSIYNNRAKSDCEIKIDAILISSYSWNNGSSSDIGPFGLDGKLSNTISFVPGYSGTGLNFFKKLSYFSSNGYRILGNIHISFSLSIWIKPNSFGGLIFYMTTVSDGSGYCVPILGITQTGEPLALLTQPSAGPYLTNDSNRLVLNKWSHLVLTVGSTNGCKYSYLFLCNFINSFFRFSTSICE